MSDIHNMERRLKKSISRLKESDYSREELEKILEFKEHLRAEGVGRKAVQRYLYSFITLAPSIDFSLLDPDKMELKKLVGKINNSEINEKDYSVWTIKEFKKAIRKFYSFLTGEEEPEIVDFISTNVKRSKKPMTSPEELPGPSEVKKLMNSRDLFRDRLMIFFTWDTGGRIGEILNVKWEDVTFRKTGAKIRFRKSKSKKREIPIYWSL